MKRGDKVKYIGKGFLGFNKDKPHAIVERPPAGTPAGSMYILYGPVKVLVRKDEVEPVTHKEVSRAGGKAKSPAKTKAVRANARKPRFNKKACLEYLETLEADSQTRYVFDSGNGWNQVDGLGSRANRSYGEWHFINTLTDEVHGRYIQPSFSKKSLLSHLKRESDYLRSVEGEHSVWNERGCRYFGRVKAVNMITKAIKNGEIK